MESVHYTELDNVHCSNDLLARALSSKHSIYIGDMLLRYDGDLLKAYKLKQDHVPTSMTGQTAPIPKGTCEDYLAEGRRLGTFHKLSHLFPKHNLYKDFDEVEIGAHSWQPKLDALQEQIDDLDSTYATDAQVVASFADQISSAGDVFTLVTNKVAVEANRADLAEQQIQADVDQNEADGDTDRALIRQQFAAADQVLDTAIQAEASTARAAEQQIQADVDQNEADGDADRAAIRQEYVAADAVVNQAVVDEAAAARAAEGANSSAIAVERSRIDSIMSLSDQSLNNFSAIQLAYEAADQSADSALTNLITTKVAAADLPTLVAQVDEVEANTLKRSNAENDSRYYQQSEVESRDNLRVLKTDYDIAIAARQTTVDQEATYRKITDSLSKADAEAADNARVLTTTFQAAVDDRQTTQQADDKYRLKTDSYDQGEVDTRDNLRVLKTDYDLAIAARQTTADQEATYRKIADSHDKDDVYTKTAADAEFYGRSHIDTQLGTKQATIGDDHLDISHTSGLQSALNAKQATIAAGDLAISHTSGLQAALNAKQATIAADSLAISHTSGLQSALNGKQASLSSDQQEVVDAHPYYTAEKDKVAANHLKISYTDAATVSGHTTDIAANTSAISGKQAALTDASGLNLNGTNAAIGKAASSGGNRLTVKGHCAFENSGSARVLTIDGGNKIEASWQSSDAIDLRVHGTGAIRMSQYHSSTVNSFASFAHAGCTLQTGLTVEGAFKPGKAAPSSATDTGTAGEIRVDANFIYVCTATNVWKRTSAGASW